MEAVRARWATYSRRTPERSSLPSAPKAVPALLRARTDRPQTRLDRNLENGMAVSIGRLRPDTQYDIQICLFISQYTAWRCRRRLPDGSFSAQRVI